MRSRNLAFQCRKTQFKGSSLFLSDQGFSFEYICPRASSYGRGSWLLQVIAGLGSETAYQVISRSPTFHTEVLRLSPLQSDLVTWERNLRMSENIEYRHTEEERLCFLWVQSPHDVPKAVHYAVEISGCDAVPDRILDPLGCDDQSNAWGSWSWPMIMKSFVSPVVQFFEMHKLAIQNRNDVEISVLGLRRLALEPQGALHTAS